MTGLPSQALRASSPKGRALVLLIVVVAVVGVVADLFHHDGEAHGVHLGVLAGGQRLYDDMLGAVDDDLCRLKLADALVVEDAALGPQDTKLSGAEGLAGVAELCQQ